MAVAKGNAGNKIRTITCVRCGTVVTKRMPPGRRYCSLDCYRTGKHPQRATGEHRECLRCGTGFYVNRARIEAGDGRYCSLTCWNLEQGRAKTSHVCKVCGKTFRWSPSRTTSGNYRITYCSIPCRDADPDRHAQLVAMNARLQRGRTTSAERLGYALLDGLEVPYLRQQSFAGKFIPDAVMPSARLVVQFDGDYWHDRGGKSTEARIRRRVALDASQDRYIRACGWEVVRLWESDLRRDPEGCAERVSQLARRPLGAAPSRDPLARGSGPSGA